jgi:hypothetical protein
MTTQTQRALAMTREQQIALLQHRQDEAIRDMETAYGHGFARAARNAKQRFERALNQQRAIEAGYLIRVSPRGLTERLEVEAIARRAKYAAEAAL